MLLDERRETEDNGKPFLPRMNGEEEEGWTLTFRRRIKEETKRERKREREQMEEENEEFMTPPLCDGACLLQRQAAIQRTHLYTPFSMGGGLQLFLLSPQVSPPPVRPPPWCPLLLLRLQSPSVLLLDMISLKGLQKENLFSICTLRTQTSK